MKFSNAIKQFLSAFFMSIIFSAGSQVMVSTHLTFAGFGTDDGPIATAKCLGIFDILWISGDFYFVEKYGCRIRKIDANNNVSSLSACASNTCCSLVDGPVATAKFAQPIDLTVDAAGNIYIADFGSFRVRALSTTGSVTSLAGGGVGFADGQGSNVKFITVNGLSVDSYGNVYVADEQNNRIRKITPSGAVTTLAGSSYGYADGIGSKALFGLPWGTAVDSKNNIYVTDKASNKIRKIDTAGNVTTLAGSIFGYADGFGTLAKFREPTNIIIDKYDNIFVVDFNGRIIRHVSLNGYVTTIAGQENGGGLDGPGQIATFASITSGTCDGLGNLYVVEFGSDRIRKISYPLNLNKLAELELLKAYVSPNPCQETINIDINRDADAEIIDVAGRIVLRIFLREGTNTLNVGHLPQGLYFLKSRNLLTKIIKE